MSAHIFSFGKTKSLKKQRRERADDKRMRLLLNGLNQAQLEDTLRRVQGHMMRTECLKLWTPHLSFAPHPDTLARVYDADLQAIRGAMVDVVECDACTRVAGKRVLHVEGEHPPGAVIAGLAARNPDLDELVMVKPGQLARPKETPVTEEEADRPQYHPNRLAIGECVCDDYNPDIDQPGAAVIGDSNHDAMEPYREDEQYAGDNRGKQ